jgi:hypothetical protein
MKFNIKEVINMESRDGESRSYDSYPSSYSSYSSESRDGESRGSESYESPRYSSVIYNNNSQRNVDNLIKEREELDRQLDALREQLEIANAEKREKIKELKRRLK